MSRNITINDEGDFKSTKMFSVKTSHDIMVVSRKKSMLPDKLRKNEECNTALSKNPQQIHTCHLPSKHTPKQKLESHYTHNRPYNNDKK